MIAINSTLVAIREDTLQKMEDVLKNYTLCEDRHAILQIEQSNPFTNNTKRRPCDSSVKTARPPEDNKWTHSQHREDALPVMVVELFKLE